MGTWKGVAGSMAAVSKTTEGAISNLGDSYEQMMAAIGQAENGPVRGLIDGLSGVTNTVRKWFEIPTSQKLMEESAEMQALVQVAQDYTKTSEERNSALQQLQATYPEYFANLTEEDVRLGKLNETLDKVNASYTKKIGLATAKEVKQMTSENLANAESERNKTNFLIQMLQNAKSGDTNARKYLSSVEGWDNEAYLYRMGGADTQIQTLKDKLKNLNDDITAYDYANTVATNDEKLAQLGIFTEKYKNKYEELTDKMNASDKAKFKALYEEYMGAIDPKASIGRGRKEKAINNAINAGQKMDEFIKGDKKSENLTKASSSTSSKSDAIIGGGAKKTRMK